MSVSEKEVQEWYDNIVLDNYAYGDQVPIFKGRLDWLMATLSELKSLNEALRYPMGNPSPSSKKESFGDGVYASVNEFGILLTTEDDVLITNEIYIDKTMVQALSKIVKDNEELLR